MNANKCRVIYVTQYSVTYRCKASLCYISIMSFDFYVLHIYYYNYLQLINTQKKVLKYGGTILFFIVAHKTESEIEEKLI